MTEKFSLHYGQADLLPPSNKELILTKRLKESFEELNLAVAALGAALVEAEDPVSEVDFLKTSEAGKSKRKKFDDIDLVLEKIKIAEGVLDKVSANFPWDKNHEYFYKDILKKLHNLNSELQSYGIRLEDINSEEFSLQKAKAHLEALGKALVSYEGVVAKKAQEIFVKKKLPQYKVKARELRKQNREKRPVKSKKATSPRLTPVEVFRSHPDPIFNGEDGYELADPLLDLSLRDEDKY